MCVGKSHLSAFVLVLAKQGLVLPTHLNIMGRNPVAMVMTTKYVTRNEAKVKEKKKKKIAEDGFDPSTSGLWAQHAPTAPLCLTAYRLLTGSLTG